ncbi:MAG: OadG family protein [Anaerolineae bacterium]|nr:OadG family protein [Anaerolineae bacterium]
MSNIEQGLTILVMGLSITFSALIIFIGIIMLLKRLFPARQKADLAREKAALPKVTGRLTRDTTEEEVAVAITVALAHLYSQELCRSNLGVDLEQGHGPWWTVGRLEQHPLDATQMQGRN